MDQKNKPVVKPPLPGESEADKKLLQSKFIEFQEKIKYIQDKLHLELKAVLVPTESAIMAGIRIEPKPDFFEHHKKKIIKPKGFLKG